MTDYKADHARRAAKEDAENAARGAALLDKHRPGWHRLITLEQLELSSGCNCICGQLAVHTATTLDKMYDDLVIEEGKISIEHGAGKRAATRKYVKENESHVWFYFANWLRAKDRGENVRDNLVNHGLVSSFGWATRHGFIDTGTPDDSSWASLDLAWKKEIRKRLRRDRVAARAAAA